MSSAQKYPKLTIVFAWLGASLVVDLLGYLPMVSNPAEKFLQSVSLAIPLDAFVNASIFRLGDGDEAQRAETANHFLMSSGIVWTFAPLLWIYLVWFGFKWRKKDGRWPDFDLSGLWSMLFFTGMILSVLIFPRFWGVKSWFIRPMIFSGFGFFPYVMILAILSFTSFYAGILANIIFQNSMRPRS